MNGTVQNLKEAWQKMPGKTKKMIAVIAAGTIILAAAGLLVLNIGTKKGYSTLFTGMSSDDAQAVVSLLQDMMPKTAEQTIYISGYFSYILSFKFNIIF